MKRMGIKTISHSFDKVIFIKENEELVIENPEVVEVIMQGQSTFQVSGKLQKVVKAIENKENNKKYSDEDIEIVMNSTNVSKEKAIEALDKANGDISLAIINLQNEKK